MLPELILGLSLVLQQSKPLMSEDLSNALKKRLQEYQLPAMAVAVVQGDQPILQAVSGVRVAKGAQLVGIGDKFHIGSCTKSMTTVLAAMLVDAGKLRWDTKLSEVFTDLTLDPEVKDITLEQLLSHRSGLRANLSDAEMDHYMHSMLKPVEQRKEMVAKLLAEKPHHKPGSEFLYANLGYSVVGAMIERIEKKPWESLLRERIFRPLGMKSAGFGPPAHIGKTDQPWGHLVQQDLSFLPVAPGPESDNPPVLGPGGIVHCSIEDQAKYARFWLQSAKAGLLSKRSIERIQTDAYAQHYGFGWILVERPWTKGLALTHAGSNTMFTTLFWIAPGRDLAIVVSTNAGGDAAMKACDEVVLDVLARIPH